MVDLSPFLHSKKHKDRLARASPKLLRFVMTYMFRSPACSLKLATRLVNFFSHLDRDRGNQVKCLSHSTLMSRFNIAATVKSRLESTASRHCQMISKSIDFCEILGHFQDKEEQRKCYKCHAGHYSDTTGSARCKKCEVMKYQPKIGMSNCLDCPPDANSTVTGAVSCSSSYMSVC